MSGRFRRPPPANGHPLSARPIHSRSRHASHLVRSAAAVVRGPGAARSPPGSGRRRHRAVRRRYSRPPRRGRAWRERADALAARRHVQGPSSAAPCGPFPPRPKGSGLISGPRRHPVRAVGAWAEMHSLVSDAKARRAFSTSRSRRRRAPSPAPQARPFRWVRRMTWSIAWPRIPASTGEPAERRFTWRPPSPLGGPPRRDARLLVPSRAGRMFGAARYPLPSSLAANGQTTGKGGVPAREALVARSRAGQATIPHGAARQPGRPAQGRRVEFNPILGGRCGFCRRSPAPAAMGRTQGGRRPSGARAPRRICTGRAEGRWGRSKPASRGARCERRDARAELCRL